MKKFFLVLAIAAAVALPASPTFSQHVSDDADDERERGKTDG